MNNESALTTSCHIVFTSNLAMNMKYDEPHCKVEPHEHHSHYSSPTAMQVTSDRQSNHPTTDHESSLLIDKSTNMHPITVNLMAEVRLRLRSHFVPTLTKLL